MNDHEFIEFIQKTELLLSRIRVTNDMSDPCFPFMFGVRYRRHTTIGKGGWGYEVAFEHWLTQNPATNRVVYRPQIRFCVTSEFHLKDGFDFIKNRIRQKPTNVAYQEEKNEQQGHEKEEHTYGLFVCKPKERVKLKFELKRMETGVDGHFVKECCSTASLGYELGSIRDPLGQNAIHFQTAEFYFHSDSTKWATLEFHTQLIRKLPHEVFSGPGNGIAGSQATIQLAPCPVQKHNKNKLVFFYQKNNEKTKKITPRFINFPCFNEINEKNTLSFETSKHHTGNQVLQENTFWLDDDRCETFSNSAETADIRSSFRQPETLQRIVGVATPDYGIQTSDTSSKPGLAGALFLAGITLGAILAIRTWMRNGRSRNGRLGKRDN